MESGVLHAAPRFRLDRWTVDADLNQISDGATVRQLRPLLMDLLRYLASKGGSVVTKNEIVEQVWGARFVTDSALARSMTELRSCLGDTVRAPKYIETIPKRGYRMIAAVHVEERKDASRQRNSIAVLPFEDLSAARDQQYLCDGIADELINSLAQLIWLRVVARTSTFAFRQKAMDVREIGRQLNATALLEGSLQMSGKQLRITVQLIDAADGYHIWSERFEGTLDDVFQLEDDIAGKVAQKMREGTEAPVAMRSQRTIPEAHRLYLQGRFHYVQATRSSFLQAIACYRRAIEVDPSCARAWAGLSECYWDGAEVGFLTGAGDLDQSRFAALKAVELDPSLGEAHALVGILRGVQEFDWPAAEHEFQEALRLSPTSPLVHERYAMFYLQAHGRTDEAMQHLQCALEADPLSPLMHTQVAHLLVLRHEYDAAMVELQHAFALAPNFTAARAVLAMTCALQGNWAGLMSIGTEFPAEDQDNPLLLGGKGWVLALAGQKDKARAILQGLLMPGRYGRVPAWSIAWIYQGLGEVDQALHWLRRVVEEHDPKVVFLPGKPFWDSLRPDPRFQALLAMMKLPQNPPPQTSRR